MHSKMPPSLIPSPLRQRISHFPLRVDRLLSASTRKALPPGRCTRAERRLQLFKGSLGKNVLASLGLLAALSAPFTGSARALSIEQIEPSGHRTEAGWADQWSFYGEPGFSLENEAIAGRNGGASRRMEQAFDFARESEVFFRVTLRRTGGGSGDEPDFAGAYLEPKRHDDSRVTLGISSYENFIIALGDEKKAFGLYTEGDTVTLVGRLQTDGSGTGVFEAWVWSADQPLPEKQPDAPIATVKGPLPSLPVGILRLAAGKRDSLRAEFFDVRAGISWSDVTATNPRP